MQRVIRRNSLREFLSATYMIQRTIIQTIRNVVSQIISISASPEAQINTERARVRSEFERSEFQVKITKATGHRYDEKRYERWRLWMTRDR